MASAPDKSQLRRVCLTARGSITPADHAAWSKACCLRIREAIAKLTPPATIIAGYAAMQGELDVTPLLEALSGAGIPTALPVVTPKSKTLLFRQWTPGAPLFCGSYGIDEPLPSAKIIVPDTLIVPMLAFDREFNRLGYGGGYYDATISAFRNGTGAWVIGAAFSLQEQGKLTPDKHDEPLDMIVTETETISQIPE